MDSRRSDVRKELTRHPSWTNASSPEQAHGVKRGFSTVSSPPQSRHLSPETMVESIAHDTCPFKVRQFRMTTKISAQNHVFLIRSRIWRVPLHSIQGGS